MFDISYVADRHRAAPTFWRPHSDLRDAKSSRRRGRLALLRMRSEIAADRVRAAFRRLEDQKAGFREDQPRWPKGSGETSGRWSGGVGVAVSSGRTKPRPNGHHLVPRSVAASQEFNLSSQARQVFDQETTGMLYGASHRFSELHRQYNFAVSDALRDYLRERGISGSSMTSNDAEDFIRRIYGSSDPRIRNFNLYLYRQRLYRILRRFGPLGRE
ncbi:hypothetical protein [Hansschlegelia zhihuaiae]|uniref:Uncharacterized protein n=1 Tax=Hansschlegelia zhihuaiae TaxID=405005 RepID=A0A4Q0MM58_9HYPH|nr:hypothetical protein [Hansschlegelia zhihuaiae]RXF74804.1 hypothetical protein EK403_05365 [Hansschlegelia zhihuaiae]